MCLCFEGQGTKCISLFNLNQKVPVQITEAKKKKIIIIILVKGDAMSKNTDTMNGCIELKSAVIAQKVCAGSA